jgi:hypothetical protein
MPFEMDKVEILAFGLFAVIVGRGLRRAGIDYVLKQRTPPGTGALNNLQGKPAVYLGRAFTRMAVCGWFGIVCCNPGANSHLLVLVLSSLLLNHDRLDPLGAPGVLDGSKQERTVT